MKDKYPRMNFKVSTKEIFGRTAIFAQINERLWMKSLSLASDYWDFIPNDPQQEENSLQPNKRVLSHLQVAFSTTFSPIYMFSCHIFLFL